MTKYRKFLSFCTTLDRLNISFFYLQILLFTSKSDTYGNEDKKIAREFWGEFGVRVIVNRSRLLWSKTTGVYQISGHLLIQEITLT
jgi:hypothetical protein